MSKPLFRYVQLAIGLWVCLVAIFAGWVFLLPHGPHFAPEIGPFGTFLYFVALYSVPYIFAGLIGAVIWKGVVSSSRRGGA